MKCGTAAMKAAFAGVSYGGLASAAFLLCLLSGVFLSLHYDPANALLSLSGILLYNPWASFWRNLHFWSAQFMLVFLLIHLWGYLRRKNFTVLRPGVWFRLGMALPLAFFLMFTGFLLKGDADSRQASLIFRNLLNALDPGEQWLAASLLGPGETLLIPYLHHVATASILLLLIVREHARKLWPGSRTFILSLLLLAIPVLWLIPPLHDGLDPVLKGPWYFAGLQELLHWITEPMLVWILGLVFIMLVWLLRTAGTRTAKLIRTGLLLYTLSYALLTVMAIFFRGAQWQLTVPGQGENRGRYPWVQFVLADHAKGLTFTDSLAGKESCLHCHDRFRGFSPGHDPRQIGCASCHGGNIFSMDQGIAHRHMTTIPGDLANVGRSCGLAACHPEMLPRIRNSLMTRLSGLIAVNHWVFGELPSPDSLFDIHRLGQSPAGLHLRNLCLSCHLGNPKTESGPLGESSRGGACLACHLQYDRKAEKALLQYRMGRFRNEMREYDHPAVSIRTGNSHCFGCHSRSGRIALSYEGWHECLEEDTAGKAGGKYRVLADGRLLEFVSADVHHEIGMQCTDCHDAMEVMGDGNLYRHKEEAVKIRCTDCHRIAPPVIFQAEDLDYESAKIRRLWGMDSLLPFIAGDISGRPLPGARLRGDSMVFRIRGGTADLPLRPPAPACVRGKVHESLSCSSCHTAWAPRCIGCHTAFSPAETGWDHLAKKETKGQWTEQVAAFVHSLPSLGVDHREGKRVIRTVVPGMIISLDQASFPGSAEKDRSFHRLYAPLEAHTTMRKGRSCKSCHNDPVALGYGEGRLEFVATGPGLGKWQFIPAYELSGSDKLPADAWIPFMGERKPPLATRSTLRPFTPAEQRRILAPGACLTCHDQHSPLMLASLDSFERLQKNMSPACRKME
ncbi:MAG TPA: hypothetical protein P5531_00140 [Bacteroidales bacterium]|nr:hypothetical protein [Bacteroidales bacterium]HSA42070.1 hypothetical protein [Bacteroidales bacterium]